MLRNKFNALKIFLLSGLLVFLITSCKKGEKVNNDDLKANFEINVDKVISILSKVNINNGDKYNKYYINDDVLYGYNLINNEYTNDFIYDVTDYKFGKGIIIKNSDSQIYLSIESDDYCAIKNFDDVSISIYDISEKDKCHLMVPTDDSIKLNIFGKNIEMDTDYKFGDVSDDYISLVAVSNLIDNRGCTYKWYRNGELIDGVDFMNYIITSDLEDAYYYAEIITNTGDVYKSEIVNVKINRAN